MHPDLILLDSITDATPEMAGKIAISGSHGGLFAAAVASRAGLRAVVLNDAGVGLDGAGLAGLKALDQVQMAGISVTVNSAEIGSASDALATGVVGYTNDTARTLSVSADTRLNECLEELYQAPTPHGVLPKIDETRQIIDIGGTKVLCVDSASLIVPEDAGAVIVTGSHGGLIGGDPTRACRADAGLVVFNDAGGGKNDIGFTRLPALEQRGIAAITLDHQTCRIGDAVSGFETGAISRCNSFASALGAAAGMSLLDTLSRLDQTRFRHPIL